MTKQHEVANLGDLPLRFEDSELVFQESVDFDTWMAIGRALARMAEGVMWWLGDWWRYGEHRYGEAAAQAVPTGYHVQTLRNAARVAERFPPNPKPDQPAPRGAVVRRPDLSWSHHKEVASLPPAEAAALLDEAAPEPGQHEPRLTTRQLHHEVQRRKDRQPPETEGATPEERLAAACARAQDDGNDWVRVRAEDVRTLLARAQSTEAVR